MQLKLNGAVVKVYKFADDLTMPWFQAKTISTYLEYAQVTRALDHVDEGDKISLQDLVNSKGLPVGGGADFALPLGHNDGKTIYVNEPGLYAMMFGSKKPEAKEFKRWVTHDVLPALRRHGSYGTPIAPQFQQLAEFASQAQQLVVVTGQALAQAETHRQEMLALREAVAAQVVAALGAQQQEVRAYVDAAFVASRETCAAQVATALEAQRREMQAFVEGAIVASRESSVIELTRQGAASSLRKEAELRRLCRPLPGGEQGVEILQEFGHLPVSSYLEQKLPTSRQHVIRSFAPVFAKALQEQRLALATDPRTEQPFMAWSLGAWRLVYFEADREMMDVLLDAPRMQATLDRMLARQAPAGGARARPHDGGRRRGPHGGSAHVNPVSLRSFFERVSDGA